MGACGVQNMYTVNVLEDADIRQGIKEFSSWPTIPQLYMNGEFVGGSDIMTELFQNEELKTVIEGAMARICTPKTPNVLRKKRDNSDEITRSCNGDMLT